MRAGFRRLCWIGVALATLGLGPCGGGSGGGTQQSAGPPVALTVQRVFAGLPSFASPVAMLQTAGDSTRWFVVEQAGRVRVFANQPAVATTALFVDISARVTFGGEAGLLGMAFHPAFPADPRVYLFYSHTDSTLGLVSRLSEFRTVNAGLTLDPGSEQFLLTIQKPNGETNHNGGNIAFGPDGFLYVGLGDGGGGNDQHGAIGNAQLTSTLLGKMLRIDISGGAGAFRYRIPPSNPFAGSALCGTDGTAPGSQSCPEIFAVGLRNPWRWSFDRLTGQLWAGDVGQGAIEEIDLVTLGGNYGWRCLEGTRATGLACGPLPSPLPPVAEYGRSVGASITGGYVYRGLALAPLIGRYVFGDFITGRIFNIAGATPPTLTLTDGFASGLSISSFGEGNDGELYVVHYGGELYRISL